MMREILDLTGCSVSVYAALRRSNRTEEQRITDAIKCKSEALSASESNKKFLIRVIYFVFLSGFFSILIVGDIWGSEQAAFLGFWLLVLMNIISFQYAEACYRPDAIELTYKREYEKWEKEGRPVWE